MPQTLRTSGRLSLAILGSRVLGLAREVVFAALFGAGAIADAYQVAFRIPNLLRDLLAEGALSSAFVPTFTAALQHDGRARAHALADLAWSGLLLVTGVLVALGLIFADGIIASISGGFAGDAAKAELCSDLARTMMPLLSLVSLGAVWMGMLNAQRHFVAPALAPGVFNVTSIVVGIGVWLAGASPLSGILVWSVGTTVAGVTQAAVNLVALVRMGYRPRLRLRGLLSDPSIRRIVRLMGPASIGLAAVQVNVYVNTIFAAELGDGPVAQLGYAFRLFYLPLGMFGVAIATIAMTEVSEEAARGDKTALARRTAESLRAAWLLTSASAVGLFVLADPVVDLVYRHGATTRADAIAIAVVLQAYVLGLLPYSFAKILSPAFFGIDRARIPALASIAGVIVNIAFNAATYRELGAPGIALGTTLGALVNVAVLRIAFARQVGPLPREDAPMRALALAAANAAMAAAVWGAWWVWSRAHERLPDLAIVRVLDAIVLTAVIALGFVVLANIARALGYPGADELAALPGKLRTRLRGR